MKEVPQSMSRPHLRQGFVDALQSHSVLYVQGLEQLKVPVLAPHLSYQGEAQHRTEQHNNAEQEI